MIIIDNITKIEEINNFNNSLTPWIYGKNVAAYLVAQLGEVTITCNVEYGH